MSLPLASEYLRRLLRYLRGRGYAAALRGIKLRHSAALDRRNQTSARAFCHVIVGKPTIHCAKAIEELPPQYILGLLLHEITHVIIGVDEVGDPELQVDEFILNQWPETDYEYSDVMYLDRNGKRRMAKNLERVSVRFMEDILSE